MSLLMLLCMQVYARLFAKSQDEYLQKRSDDFKRWQAGLLKEEEEIELKEKIVCGIWVFARLGAAIFLLCALIVFVEGRGRCWLDAKNNKQNCFEGTISVKERLLFLFC